MIRFAADENFDGVLLRALLRQNPNVDIVRIQDTDIMGADDPTVLEWTANNQRILLTHDVRTMIKYAYERVVAGLPMAGIIEVDTNASFGVLIEDLLTAAEATSPADWENKIDYFPMK